MYLQLVLYFSIVALLDYHIYSFKSTHNWLKTAQNYGIRYNHIKSSNSPSPTSLSALFDDSLDITANGDSGILKKLKRKGNPTKGYPQAKDVVQISWKIYHLNGTLAHDSSGLAEPFEFTIGANPRHVILGWETAVKSMYEGEISSFTLQSNYAFGVTGMPLLSINPNTAINCELEIMRLRPNVNRVYQSVGVDESIKDELMEKIHSGESVVSSEVMANKRINATKTEDERLYYDPVKHQLDPNQVVKGEGEDHIWEETPTSIDVEIPLPIDRYVRI
jgi:hypothetical protein